MINLEKLKNEKPILELLNFGILNIDKPAGMTSFDVVNAVRKSLGLKKCGHFGTLDPNVTGVLPIALGNACKVQEYFMHHEKTYIGTMQLHKPTTLEKLESEMKKFIGKINQLPPRISRVKRQIRQREVIEFKILKFDEKKKTADFIAEVEAGTYIRKLIDDLGKGISGAQMISLRRIKAGIFSDKDNEFVSLADFEKAADEYKRGKANILRRLITPAEIITKILPIVEVNEEALKKLKNGSPIFSEMLEDEKKAIPENSFAVFFKDIIVEIAKKVEEPISRQHFQNIQERDLNANARENPNILARPEVVIYT